jgi:hypothetical protein
MNAAPRIALARLTDPRVWVGFAITAVALWLALRGVSLRELAEDVAGAQLRWLLALAVPAYVWSVHLRALRWKVLARHITPVRTGAAFRATAVGFMVNSLFPLRLGEIARAFVLARDTRASAGALFGTVVLERVIDAVCVVGIAAVVIGSQIDLDVLVVGAAVPAAAILALRLWPEPLLRLAARVGHALMPARLAERADRLLRDVAEGLGGLRLGTDLVRVALHSALLWGVAAPIHFYAAQRALGLAFGSPADDANAAFVTMVAVGAAVAIPSAPGFFGPYHAACRFALVPLGVSAAHAIALGTLAHLTFWIASIVLGLACLRAGGGRLAETIAHEPAELTRATTP